MSDVRRTRARRTTVAFATLGLIGLMAAPATASASAGARPGRPTRAAVTSVMRRTVEVGDTSEHFVPDGKAVSAKDGPLALTAVVGQRSPTADGDGQLVFFWRGRTFLGWDSIYESVDILRVTPWGAHALRVTYAHNAAKDPVYAPSLPPVNVYYRWRDGRLVGDRLPPSLSYLDQRVELMPPTGAKPAATSRVVKVTAKDSGTAITVARGTLVRLVLAEDPSTGYDWTLTVGHGLKLVKSAYVPPASAIPGAGGRHVWRIRATTKGSHTLTGVYRQVGGQGPTEQFRLTVVVK